MRGLIGGMLTGGLVSVVGLGAVSVMSEQPAGVTPPDAPLVQAPMVEPVDPVDTGDGPSTPVGSLTIQEPLAPDLPEGEASVQEPNAPTPATAQPDAPRADTDPLDEPDVMSIEGAMQSPDAPTAGSLFTQPVDPVLPNPQSRAPQTPVNEADLSVSTTPSQPNLVVVPDDDVAVADGETPPQDESFVIDLGADAPTGEVATPQDPIAPDPDVIDAPAEQPEDEVLATTPPGPAAPRLQLQGGENTLLGDRDTGVTVRRPDAGTEAVEDTAQVEDITTDALTLYAAEVGDTGGKPLMSIVLIDDGTMSAAAAALAGLPFPVTIAIDPALANAADLLAYYRADGFEVAVMAKLPEGALPTDVEVTFQSVFATLPEIIAVLDIGQSGLQTDRDVTEQAMEILAAQGRGFLTASQGLNMAGRAANAAGVPYVVVYRDLDAEGQDARVVRRFVDQAAFRARQESGVVLVGRVRPDTISALILWGTANQNDQVAVVPVSAVLNAQ